MKLFSPDSTFHISTARAKVLVSNLFCNQSARLFLLAIVGHHDLEIDATYGEPYFLSVLKILNESESAINTGLEILGEEYKTKLRILVAENALNPHTIYLVTHDLKLLASEESRFLLTYNTTNIKRQIDALYDGLVKPRHLPLRRVTPAPVPVDS